VPILSAAEAREQYQSTLSTIAHTALFQYTFVAAILYVAETQTGATTYELLGFRFSRVGWGWIGLLGSTTINLYIGRLITYLISLGSLYPFERRVLRYLTRHHRWFLNPFRVLIRPRLSRRYRQRHIRIPLPLLSATPYAAVLVVTQVPLIALLEGGLWVTNPQLHGFARVLGWLLIPVWLWSGAYLMYRIAALGNLLWRGRYSPSR
jgi:hypothetical protein